MSDFVTGGINLTSTFYEQSSLKERLEQMNGVLQALNRVKYLKGSIFNRGCSSKRFGRK